MALQVRLMPLHEPLLLLLLEIPRFDIFTLVLVVLFEPPLLEIPWLDVLTLVLVVLLEPLRLKSCG